jgi:hypothetical protein
MIDWDYVDAEDMAREIDGAIMETIAKDNFLTAIDQQQEYDSLQFAFDSYAQNAVDTIAEYEPKVPHCLRHDYWAGVLSCYCKMVEDYLN